MKCTACGYEFPPPPKPKPKLHDDDIMRIAPFQMRVTDWRWDKHISRTSGLEMLRISYYSGLTNDPVREYMPVRHEGYAGRKAVETVAILARSAGADVFEIDDLTELAQVLSRSTPPAIVEYKRDGKFHKVVRRIWNVTPTSNAA
jgi:DNA repair protein RadD